MENACCKVSEAGLRQDAFCWLRRRSWACPLLARSLSEGTDRGDPNPPPPGSLWQGLEQGPRFCFFSFPTTTEGLCVCYSDPNQRNIKSLSGWRLWLLRPQAVGGAEEK